MDETVKVKHEQNKSQDSSYELLPLNCPFGFHIVCFMFPQFLVRHYTLYCLFPNCKNASWTVQCPGAVKAIKLYIYLLLFTLNKLNAASSLGLLVHALCQRVQTNEYIICCLFDMNKRQDLGRNIMNGGPICPLCPPNWPFHAEDNAASLSLSHFSHFRLWPSSGPGRLIPETWAMTRAARSGPR